MWKPKKKKKKEKTQRTNPLGDNFYTMSERENNVYKAKLAEQAERYDGKWKKW